MGNDTSRRTNQRNLLKIAFRRNIRQLHKTKLHKPNKKRARLFNIFKIQNRLRILEQIRFKPRHNAPISQ